MDKNEKYYKAAWHLVGAATELRTFNEELANWCLDRADELRKEIVIDDKEVKEIEKYEELLKNESIHN